MITENREEATEEGNRHRSTIFNVRSTVKREKVREGKKVNR